MNNDVELDYPSLMDSALRAIVRDVLSITAELGAAPGEHHFYIEFRTGADGVSIPESLRSNYPDKMTIVLQHQFKDLLVEEERFSVTLWFKGEPADLVIPFDAVTTFADPSVQFELRYAQDDGAVLGDMSDDEPEDAGPAAEIIPAPLISKARKPDARDTGSDADGSKPREDGTNASDDGRDAEIDKDDGGNDDEGNDAAVGGEVVSLDAFRKK